MFAIVGIILFFWLGYMWYVTLTHINDKIQLKKLEKAMKKAERKRR